MLTLPTILSRSEPAHTLIWLCTEGHSQRVLLVQTGILNQEPFCSRKEGFHSLRNLLTQGLAKDRGEDLFLRSANEACNLGVELLRLLPGRGVATLFELHQAAFRDVFPHVISYLRGVEDALGAVAQQYRDGYLG